MLLLSLVALRLRASDSSSWNHRCFRRAKRVGVQPTSEGCQGRSQIETHGGSERAAPWRFCCYCSPPSDLAFWFELGCLWSCLALGWAHYFLNPFSPFASPLLWLEYFLWFPLSPHFSIVYHLCIHFLRFPVDFYNVINCIFYFLCFVLF